MIYTVHVPRDVYDAVAAAERARFLRDGFSWGAFFLGPLWFLWQRCWIGLALDILLLMAVVLLFRGAGLPLTATTGLLLALMVLTGFEGPSLLRWSTEGGYRCVDVVSALTREEAEHQFLRRQAERPAGARTSVPAPGGDLPLGLFPEETG